MSFLNLKKKYFPMDNPKSSNGLQRSFACMCVWNDSCMYLSIYAFICVCVFGNLYPVRSRLHMLHRWSCDRFVAKLRFSALLQNRRGIWLVFAWDLVSVCSTFAIHINQREFDY